MSIFIPFPCVFMRNFGMCFRISMIYKIYIFLRVHSHHTNVL